MSKPRYGVPSMDEIADIPWNGYSVVSTFSGAGGSCLGYRMAGYRVLWANEFIPAAQEVYTLNHPDSILDTRDIRDVTAADILDAIDMHQGDVDLLDGSPPCASFSTAGNRDEDWGKVKQYSDTQQRVDDLFFEYARILDGLQPKTFVAENVSGLVKGKAKGYFKMILRRLTEVGYRVRVKLLDAQWLGVPQRRERVIFIGVREDLDQHPAFPDPLAYRYTVADAFDYADYSDTDAYVLSSDKMLRLYDHTPQGAGFDVAYEQLYGKRSMFLHRRLSPTQPAPTANQGTQDLYHPTEARSLNISELKAICSFPNDFALTGSFAKRWERIARTVPPLMMKRIAETIQTEVLDQCQ